MSLLLWALVGELLPLLTPPRFEIPALAPAPPFVIGSVGIKPSFIRFFCFILRFWNHIFTCVSFNCRAEAISILLALVRYLLKWNSFSSSVSCLLVKFVLPVLLRLLGPPSTPPRVPVPMRPPPPTLHPPRPTPVPLTRPPPYPPVVQLTVL